MRRAISFLLICFTLALFYNNAVNWHYHQLPNGIVVEHAHPYNKAAFPSDLPFEKHHHSDFEYLILDLVYYSGLIVLLTVLMLSVFRESMTRRKILTPVPVYLSINTSLPLLRAPPSI